MTGAAAMKNCPHHKKMMKQTEGCSEDNNCCSNKLFHFQLDQDKQVQTFDFTVSQELHQFVASFVTVFFSNNLIKTEPPLFVNYRPPPIIRDIPVLVQSFLL